ncbi:uncharacterized protein PG986_012582 [Apiospora aurea]|uniref:ATP-dependent RNA helicase DHX8 n=1 Tax=Apiospora aurea TaxID=335848 RepID=A0ABR1Q0E2_9PEZI
MPVPPPPSITPPPPYRQIRALHDAETITVYQAYNAEIASAAVAQQRLDASPRFRTARMTWIKPSWCWMLYRAGYSYKDPNQARILALRMRRAGFWELLRRGGPRRRRRRRSGSSGTPSARARLEKLGYRSIQIGVPAALQARWVAEWIESIEDVTEKARELKRFVVPPDLQEVLGMAMVKA